MSNAQNSVSVVATTRKLAESLLAVGYSETRLADVMGYEFQPLIDRMVDKYGWTEPDAEQTFEDTKRFLYLCDVTLDGPLAPSPKIDEMWHNFILHTEDYYQFCRQYFRRFIHHRPRRRNDLPTNRSIVRDTLRIAQATFGELSTSWDYAKKDGSTIEANSGCDASCNGHCGGSTNCQDGD